jgi:hypothetical protein
MRPTSKLTREIWALASLLLVGNLSTLSLPAQDLELVQPAAAGCIATPSGLVSWWQAEDSAADTVGPNNGSLMNGATVASGNVGKAFNLNGTSQYVSISDSPSLRQTNITVEGWFNFTVTTGLRMLVAKPYGSGTSDSYNIWYDGTVGQLRGCVSATTGVGPYLSYGWVPVVGTWYHIALTFDAAAHTQTLYVNGTVVASGTVIGSIGYDSHALQIGADIETGVLSLFFGGLIDEVSLYSRALSASEILGIYLAGSAGKCAPAPPSCSPPASGLISWWRAEDSASDTVGANEGTMMNGATVASGKVGLAFNLNGTSQYIAVPDSPSLRPASLTVEGWFKFSGSPSAGVIAIKPLGTGRLDSFALWYQNSSQLCAAITTPNGEGAWLSYNSTPAAGWHHAAYTYDYSSGSQVLYFDGVAVASGNVNGPIAYDARPFQIGSDIEYGSQFGFFKGLIDEVALYDRALSASEIAAIYNAGSFGKCSTPTPPTLTGQPAAQTNILGDTVTFTVAASGSPWLTYQWLFNHVSLVGKTNSTLTLVDVQIGDAGNYSCLVTNPVGAVLSSNALLVVNPPPHCTLAPSSMVAWWRANGDVADVLGTNNGTLTTGATFAPGRVGQAFSLNGTNHYVSIPDNPSLRPASFTWEGWFNLRALTGSPLTLFAKPYGTWTSDSFGAAYNAGQLQASVHTANGDPTLSFNWIPVLGTWHHIAQSFDNVGHMDMLYLDGVLVASNSVSGSVLYDTHPVMIGADIQVERASLFFNGLADEVSLYNRALTPAEIAAIYAADRSGKCAEPPFIVSQPEDQMVTENHTAVLSVVAGGTPDLHYQWRFNGTNIAGATAASLTLTNVHLSNAGLYSVRVANLFGTLTSSNALLAVNRAPVPVIEVRPLARLPGYTNLVIAPNCGNAKVFFSAAKSFDPDSTAWECYWYAETDCFSTQKVASLVLEPGISRITLWVDDNCPDGTNSASVAVQVLTPGQAVGVVIDLVSSSSLAQNRQQALLAPLKNAQKSFDKCNALPGLLQLYAFRFHVRAQVDKSDPAMAGLFIDAANQIVNALLTDSAARPPAFRFREFKRLPNGKTQLTFQSVPAQMHLIQASSDLKSWETIGVAQDNGDGTFSFEDPTAAALPNRFYRIVVP